MMPVEDSRLLSAASDSAGTSFSPLPMVAVFQVSTLRSEPDAEFLIRAEPIVLPAWDPTGALA